MSRAFSALPILLAAAVLTGQPAPRPTLAEVRAAMGIPSAGDLRGQQDAVGFASTAAQMAELWKLAALPPAPEGFGPLPAPGAAGAILPHDDYLYAGRVYRRVAPLVTARTVVLVGTFHKYRAFGARGHLVLDPYRAWRAPDGEIPVSPLRDALRAALLPGDAVQDAACHDREHSLEAVAYWLRHQRPDLEILPLLVPEMDFARMQALASRVGTALARAMKARGLALGRDVAVVLSSDGVHYGGDFAHTPFGAGGVAAFTQAMDQERALLTGPLAGPISADKARSFFETCVDPEHPGTYRLTWCGRFAVPFGLLLLEAAARELGEAAPIGRPVALGASVEGPELPVKPLGLGATAPANLHHFVAYPGVAFLRR